MYAEMFQEVHLTIVELPIEFVANQPVYRGFIRELPMLAAEGHSRQMMYRQLWERYDEYRQMLQVEETNEEMTSSLLTADQLMKYYDGETFDGFDWQQILK